MHLPVTNDTYEENKKGYTSQATALGSRETLKNNNSNNKVSPSAEDRDRDTAGEKKGIGIGFGTVHTG